MKSNKSTYFFIGKLSDYTAQYQVQNFFVNSNFVLEIFMNGFSVWGSSKGNFDQLRTKVIQMIDIIVAAYIFKTNKNISYRLDNWVETKEKIARKNIIGWLRPPNTPAIFKSTRSPINTPWKKAAKLYSKIVTANPNYAIALQDYSSAIRNVGDDAYFYAYRAIEDICRAVTGKNDTQKAWTTMHKILNTTREQIEPLAKVAEEIRHGKRNTDLIKKARKNKKHMLKISQTVIGLALERKFPEFI